jgi:hypothetical protein
VIPYQAGEWLTQLRNVTVTQELEEAQRDFRRTDWIFLGVGLGSMLLAIGFFFGGLWVASLLLLPFGALFCYVSYLSLRHR